MAKFFYSKTNDTTNASQAENGIILNWASNTNNRYVKFYKNKNLIKNVMIPNYSQSIENGINNIQSWIPSDKTQVYSSFFTDTNTPAGLIMPTSTNTSSNAFSYMKANNSNWPR